MIPFSHVSLVYHEKSNRRPHRSSLLATQVCLRYETWFLFCFCFVSRKELKPNTNVRLLLFIFFFFLGKFMLYFTWTIPIHSNLKPCLDIMLAEAEVSNLVYLFINCKVFVFFFFSFSCFLRLRCSFICSSFHLLIFFFPYISVYWVSDLHYSHALLYLSSYTTIILGLVQKQNKKEKTSCRATSWAIW